MICLMPNCCFLSETTRLVAIGRALRDRGAAVRFATHGGTYADVVRRAGFELDVLGPGWDADRCAAFVRAVPGIGAPDSTMWSHDELLALAREEAAYLTAHGVRTVVTGWLLTALLSTRLAGIPLVTEHSGAMVPPVFERGGLPAPERRLGLPAERFLPRRLRTRLYNAGYARLRLYTDGLERAAAELGVEGVPSLPAMLLGDLALVTEAPEVLGVSRERIDRWRPRDPSRYRRGTRLRCTGPLPAPLDVPVPPRVEEFLGRPGPPVVLVSLSSSSPDLVRAVVRALAALDVRVLVAGTVHGLADLDTAGVVDTDDVLVEALLPNHLVMPRVAAAVVTGGQTTVQTALAAGLPFVGLPLQPEQDTNVVLVQRRGAARRVAPQRVGEELPAAVRAVLGDERHRRAARDLQRVYAATDGAGACADTVLEVAAAAPAAAWSSGAHLR